MRHFSEEREWGPYHQPRNLVLALAGEVGELAAEFQWTADDEILEALKDPARAARVRHELADVLHCTLRLADILGVTLGASLIEKLALTASRYPVDEAKGIAEKWTRLPHRSERE